MASNAIGSNNATQTALQDNRAVANNDTFGQSLTPEQFAPTISEMPESKPIYDSVRRVQSFEYPVALIESNGKCKAYSDQGTLLDIPQNFCKKWLRDGRYNPYKTQPQQQPTQPNNELLSNLVYGIQAAFSVDCSSSCLPSLKMTLLTTKVNKLNP